MHPVGNRLVLTSPQIFPKQSCTVLIPNPSIHMWICVVRSGLLRNLTGFGAVIRTCYGFDRFSYKLIPNRFGSDRLFFGLDPNCFGSVPKCNDLYRGSNDLDPERFEVEPNFSDGRRCRSSKRLFCLRTYRLWYGSGFSGERSCDAASA